jgi:hypothetical protein
MDVIKQIRQFSPLNVDILQGYANDAEIIGELRRCGRYSILRSLGLSGS